MCLYCIGKVSNCSIKSCGTSWSANEDTIYAYTKALLGKNCLRSHSCHFVKNYYLFMQMLNVSTLYRQSIKLLHLKWWYELIGQWRHHLCIYKSLIREKLSKIPQLSFCQKVFFVNQTPSCICSMCQHCIGNVSDSSIKSCGRSWSAHEGTIYAYTHTLLGKNCLGSHSCHFVKNYFCEPNSFMHLHCIGKVSNCSIKSCGRSWSAHEGTIYAYTNSLLGKNCLGSHSCHFVEIIFCEPNSFMHMFNVSTLYRQSIKLLHQKLW